MAIILNDFKESSAGSLMGAAAGSGGGIFQKFQIVYPANDWGSVGAARV